MQQKETHFFRIWPVKHWGWTNCAAYRTSLVSSVGIMASPELPSCWSLLVGPSCSLPRKMPPTRRVDAYPTTAPSYPWKQHLWISVKRIASTGAGFMRNLAYDHLWNWEYDILLLTNERQLISFPVYNVDFWMTLFLNGMLSSCTGCCWERCQFFEVAVRLCVLLHFSTISCVSGLAYSKCKNIKMIL